MLNDYGRAKVSTASKCIDMEGAMRKRIRIVSMSLVLLFPLWLLPAAESTTIIRSPYYGSSAAVNGAETIELDYLAQLGLTTQESPVPATVSQERLLAAISNNYYPVTPGDTLSLFYTEGKNTTSLTLQVDGSYRVSIPTLGTVNGKDKTFVEFAREIEQLVVTYLPYSLPRVTLIGTGAFSVAVRGEVTSTREVPAWGLSRLSSVIGGATNYASTRQIRITARDGSNKTYDLYAALREGDLAQNPYVKAGDVITIPQAERLITLAGEVVRPGVYQPLEGESLHKILETYGNGVLPSGDARALLVRRFKGDSSSTVDVLRVSAEELESFAVQHLDTIFVNPIVPLTRAVSIEGAVTMGGATVLPSALNSSGRLYYQFFPGETVVEMLQTLSQRFSAVSDLGGTYLLRGEQLIPIDVQSILMGRPSEVATLVLLEGDRFVVPFNQLFVNVAGAVLKPGTFPYIPDKKADYYIHLAGGFDPAKNRNGAFTVIDKQGNKLSENAIVPPEAIVNAKLNTFQAVNGLNLATTVTIVGLVATITSIIVNIVALSSK